MADGQRDVDAELAAALRSLAPPEVRTGHRRIDARDVASLKEVEAAHVRHAVERRRCEFATGRALLRDLIGSDDAIPVAPDRSPMLPDGLRGSLAHDGEHAIAAVSDDPTIAAIGIDIEPSSPLDVDAAAIILREDERGLDAHHAFTMKEATYKAWSALGGRTLDHEEVGVSIVGQHFRANIVSDATSFIGSWRATESRWITLVIVREGGPTAIRPI